MPNLSLKCGGRHFAAWHALGCNIATFTDLSVLIFTGNHVFSMEARVALNMGRTVAPCARKLESVNLQVL